MRAMSTDPDFIIPEFITVAGERIAVRRRAGAAPGAVWLGGFRSDMTGTKAEALDGWAAANGHELTDGTVTGKGFSASLVSHRADLSAGLDEMPLEGVRLVTASALLDLVSADWLASLVDLCRRHSLACYAALTYDGRLDWTPVDRLDAEMHALFDRHQRGTKSFGPALGPDAAQAAAAAFRAAGFSVETGRSDWQLEAGDRDMQEALLAGYVQAALEIAPERAGEIEHWRQRRRFAIGAGTSRHRVGHTDLLALPRG